MASRLPEPEPVSSRSEKGASLDQSTAGPATVFSAVASAVREKEHIAPILVLLPGWLSESHLGLSAVRNTRRSVP